MPQSTGKIQDTRINVKQVLEGAFVHEDTIQIHFVSTDPESGHRLVCLTHFGPNSGLAQTIGDFLFDKHRTSPNQELAYNDARDLNLFLEFTADLSSHDGCKFERISDLPGNILSLYADWLDELRSMKDLEAPRYSDASKYNIWLDASNFFWWCRENDIEIPDYFESPRNPWPDCHLTTESHKVLSQTHLLDIRKTCLDQIDLTYKKIRRGRRAMRDSVIVPSPEAPIKSYRNFEVALKSVASLYPNRPCGSFADLRLLRPKLARAINRWHSYTDIREHLFPDAIAMVPFVVILGMDGYFNATTLFSMKTTDIDKDHILYGKERWRIAGDKARSGRRQYRSFAASGKDPSSVVSVLNKLLDITSSYRHLAAPYQSAHLFLFARPQSTGFETFEQGRARTNSYWTQALKIFIRQRRLDPFYLANLRASGADTAYTLSGGDIRVVSEVLNHTNIQTTYSHYFNQAARQHGQDALAEALMWRERYIASNGRSDSRDAILWEGRNSSATPGFGCFEPKYSPVVGQAPGRPCAAYGCCPACPMAWVDVGNPRSLVKLLQLRGRILQARDVVSSHRWVGVWREQLAALDDFWLRLFSVETHEAALTINLHDLPHVE